MAQGLRVGDPQEDLLRLQQLRGERSIGDVSIRPVAGVAAPNGGGLRFLIDPAELRLGTNTARPWGVNDGQLWQGRGGSFAFRGGITMRAGPFSAALRPVLTHAANTAFGLSPLAIKPDLSSYAYPANRGSQIDLPQRFGDDPVTTLGWGDSFIRAELGPVAVSLSNENHWWGPARRNAIAMTNNAPGFGHVWLGTSRPVDIRVGKFEARWLWGSLWESDYFDADPANDQRYFTGLVATFRPKWTPGLELGATRTFIQAWPSGGPGVEDLLLVLIPLQKKHYQNPENPTGNDQRDQMATVFARWVSPAAGFELYGEWGRGDHAVDLRDLATQPEHAGGWMAGLQKVLAADDERVWRFVAEATALGATRTYLVRPPSTAFYAHHIVRQGYTMRGQVIGAGIGPGSSQVFLGVDRFASWGRVGAGIQRTSYDNDRFYLEHRFWTSNESEPAFITDALVSRGPWDIGGSLSVAQLLNKHYVHKNDEVNVNASLSVRYHFGAR